MKRTILKKLAVILSFIMIFTVNVYGEDGEGGGSDYPLELSSSTIADGETGVEIDREILLIFSKNVNNITVKENNIGMFDVVDAAGLSVLANVVTFDDQLDRDNRNNIMLEANLEEGQEYTIFINGEMMSKSGQTLAGAINISFTTAGGEAEETPVEEASAEEPVAEVHLTEEVEEGTEEVAENTIDEPIEPVEDAAAEIEATAEETPAEGLAEEDSTTKEDTTEDSEEAPEPGVGAETDEKPEDNTRTIAIIIGLGCMGVAMFLARFGKRKK